MEILVFKTNLYTPKRVNSVEPYIQKLPGVLRWNVDLHDHDKVLRIEARDLSPRLVEHALNNAGFTCKELD